MCYHYEYKHLFYSKQENNKLKLVLGTGPDRAFLHTVFKMFEIRNNCLD